ncbi:MAG TPA: RluA family pseudouridine synthase [Xanthobacteraceae bacterium]|jgi:23S rRNA pseudouridine1911/1915/1917 synthase
MTAAATNKSIHVPDGESGQRLDRLLAANIGDLSRTRIKRLIEAGAVTIDGATIRDPSHRVNSGAMVALEVPPPEPATPTAEAIPLNVVYEDADIIVIDKPSGLVVHPAAGHWTGTLVNALIAHCGESLSGIGGEKRPGIVHRLDKDTSGLMVVAKNDRAHRRLAAQFAAHGRDGRAFERGYLTFVWGAPDRPRGTIDRPIDRHRSVRTRMAVQQGGREAVTHWQLLERFGVPTRSKKPSGKLDSAASLLACTLETGRTHQIRVHLASIGHPVLGDGVYGAGFRSKAALLPESAQSAVAALGRQALHAHILAFEHPASGKLMRFRSELPPDLARLHGKLAASRADSSEK